MLNDVNQIFKAIGLAMGVVTVVLSILRAIDVYSSITMLGIGLLCLGIDSLNDN